MRLKTETGKPVDMVTIPGRIYLDDMARREIISFMADTKRLSAPPTRHWGGERRRAKLLRTSTGSFLPQRPLVPVGRGGRKGHPREPERAG